LVGEEERLELGAVGDAGEDVAQDCCVFDLKR